MKTERDTKDKFKNEAREIMMEFLNTYGLKLCNGNVTPTKRKRYSTT